MPLLALRALALIVGIGAGLPAAAQPGDCGNATTQRDMTACTGQAFAKADAELNAAYARLRQQLSPASQARLRDAQRAWIAFRDRECLMQSNGSDGGSAAAMVRFGCAERLTRERTAALIALAQCPEGDLACPR